MKIRCVCCKHKFEPEVDEKGIPKTNMCPSCTKKYEERKGKNG